MDVTRRRLMAAGAGLGAAALAGCGGSSSPRTTENTRARRADLQDWAQVKALYPLAEGRHDLAAFLLAPHVRPVAEAIETHRRGLDADPSGYLKRNGGRLERDTVDALAGYLGCDPAAVALTDSTTMGLGTLYRGLALRRGQHVLTTAHDHYATHESLRLSGAPVRRVPLYGARSPARASVDEIVSRVKDGIRPRTRVLAVTWVHSSTGVKLPVAEIASVVRDANRGRGAADRLLLCVDGVHALGVEDPSLGALGADFLVAGCHKWLAGPRGTGLVAARSPSTWEDARVRPTIPTFSAGDGPGAAFTPGGYHSFEHRWALGAAVELHRSVGPARVTERIHALARRLKEGLAERAPRIALATPMHAALSAGIVCFDVRDREPREVVGALEAEGVVASVTPYARRYVRLGTGLFADEGTVDAALKALDRI